MIYMVVWRLHSCLSRTVGAVQTQRAGEKGPCIHTRMRVWTHTPDTAHQHLLKLMHLMYGIYMGPIDPVTAQYMHP